jgi:hypothetical protein
MYVRQGFVTLGLAARVYRDGLTVDKTSGGEEVLHWGFHCCEKLHYSRDNKIYFTNIVFYTWNLTMGLYTILYYPSNNEPLPSSHLTIGYIVALPNITNVTIATLTTHLLAPATL